MVKYGQIVKLTAPHTFEVRDHFKNVVQPWLKKYPYKTIKTTHQGYGGYTITTSRYKIEIPAGTLGLLRLVYVSHSYTTYYIVIPHPETNLCTGKNNTLKIKEPDFTTEITPEEKELMHPIQVGFLLHKFKDEKNNLKIMEKLAQLQRE
jgi:hypothetical protein